MGKIDTLKSVVDQCDDLIAIVETEYPDIEEGSIEKFVYQVVNTYYPNISNLTYCVTGRDLNEQEDMLESLTALKSMLNNYKDELEDASKQFAKRNGNLPHINISQIQNNNQSQNVKISITIEEVIDVIYNIPDSVLGEDDKDILIGKLNSLEKTAHTPEQDKSKVWDKAKGILALIADKGADAGIALLPTIPYVVQLMQNIK